MKKIDVLLPGKNYSIYIGRDLFAGLETRFSKEKIPHKILAVVDSKVVKLHKEKLNNLLKSKNYSVEIFPFTASEKSKNLKSVEKIYSRLQRGNYGRDTALLAIGGGITGDVTAFAASTYMRGIKYIQAPTTLLAAVDSSVGGKTGVNFNSAKNFVGTFYQPEFVVVDTSFMDTLPQDEIICGLGEALKTTFLADEKLSVHFNSLLPGILKGELTGIENLIFEPVKFKAGVVAADEKEAGLRKILNLGHTFGHALETGSDFKIKHGQAVVFGIVCALFLSLRVKLLDKKDFEEGIYSIGHLKNFITVPHIDPALFYNLMLADKKTRGGRIKFILIKGRGKVFVDVEAGKPDVIAAINSAYNYFHSTLVL